MRNRLPIAAVILAASALTACGSDTESASPDPTATTVVTSAVDSGEPLVEIERSRFGPQDLTVAVGAEVRFVNLDRATHTVTARDDSGLQFDSGDLGQDEDFTQLFDAPGTYAYFCEIHPTMRGTVVVG